MTIAQTERASYRSKKNYAKFGRLKANKNLNMHEVSRTKTKYKHKKISSQINDPDFDSSEKKIKSNSLIRINNLKMNIQKKRKIKEKLADNDKREPITIKKSGKKIDSKKGGKFEYENLKKMKLLKNNEVKELLRNEEDIKEGKNY